ncbi:MAG: hypothetical protein ACOYYJ_19920 [Chloroflexota bacterium]
MPSFLFTGLTKDTSRNIAAFFFLAVLVFFWTYGFQRRDYLFVHDAMNYWSARYNFIDNGQFSILHYNSPLRGYLFPLLLFLIQWQADVLGIDAQMLFLTYSALFVSVLAFYLLPWFFRVVFEWKTPVIKRLLFSGLLFFFWRGHFLYPLTDFPSLAFLLLGIGIFVRIGLGSLKPAWAVLAGFAIGAAVNIRPVYQVSLVVVLVLLCCLWRRLGKKDVLISVVFFFFGAGMVFYPQLLINQLYFETNSPLVLSTYIEDESIYEIQLFWGLKTQKYETNIGDDYPFASVVYRDPLADKLPQRFLRDKTTQGYINIIRSYPLEVAVSYFRHFFNGLDVFFSTPYVRKIYAGHFLLSFANYLIWFLALYYMIAHTAERVTCSSFGVVLAMLAPVALAVPIVVEVRFFLPMYLLAYGIVSYGLNYKEMLLYILRTKSTFLLIVLLLFGWMLVCFTLSAGTIEKLQ